MFSSRRIVPCGAPCAAPRAPLIAVAVTVALGALGAFGALGAWPRVAAAQPTPSETQTPGGSQSDTSGPASGEGQPPTPDAPPADATGDGATGGAATADAPDRPDAPAGAEPGGPDRSSDTTNAAAAATATRATGAQEVDPGELPPIEAEVQGTCRTPRQAWLQLLYWLQKGTRWDPRRAAICFDTSRLDDPAVEAPRRAEMLKRTLDGANARIHVDDLPTDPRYRDPDGRSRFLDPAAEREFGDRIYLMKKNGRWLFSAETVATIPDLYPALTGWLQEILPAWAQTEILGVELWKYAAVILLLVIAAFVRRLIKLLVATYVRRLVSRINLRHLDTALDRAHRPLGGLAMAAVFYVAFPMLLFPLPVAELVGFAVTALAAFSAVWLAYRLIDVIGSLLSARAALTESKLDDQLVPLVSKTFKVFVSVIGGIFILQNINVEIGSLLAGLGIGGLAFALAAKDTIANFFGSVMIFIDKPFQIGDWVVMSGTEGVVEEVGFRTSRVRTFYNSLVTVPNQLVTNAIVDNYGARQFRRYSTNLGLTYDTPPDKVEAFCEGVRAIIAGMPGMRKDYYLVEFKEFGASSLVVMLYCFMVSTTWNDELRTRTNLNLEILRLGEQLGVSFAFPTQTLHVDTLARPGESNPSHSGPSEHPELAAVIDAFGPGGARARPGGLTLSHGYHCDGDKKGGSSGDG